MWQVTGRRGQRVAAGTRSLLSQTLERQAMSRPPPPGLRSAACPVTVPRNHFREKLPGQAFRAPRGLSFHRGPPRALMRDTEASGRACERTGGGDVKPWRPGRGLCPERFSHTEPCNEACLEGSLGVGYGQDTAAKMSV